MTNRRRTPTKARSVAVGAIILVVGLLLAAAAVVIAVRADGDLSTVLGTGGGGRSGGAAPAWFGIAVAGVLAVAVSAFGVLVAVIGWRAAESASTSARPEP